MFGALFAGTYYYFDNLQGNSFDQGSGSNNTRGKNGEDVLAFGYSALALGGQVGMTLPLDIVPYAALFGEHVQNVDSEDSNGNLDNDDDYGWLLGFKFGPKKNRRSRHVAGQVQLPPPGTGRLAGSFPASVVSDSLITEPYVKLL
jgi:hypothetical protein